VEKVLAAFDWRADELLGNMTARELLTQQIDIRSKKINKRKIFAEALNKAEDQPLIDELLEDTSQFTLLELA